MDTSSRDAMKRKALVSGSVEKLSILCHADVQQESKPNNYLMDRLMFQCLRPQNITTSLNFWKENELKNNILCSFLG